MFVCVDDRNNNSFRGRTADVFSAHTISCEALSKKGKRNTS